MRTTESHESFRRDDEVERPPDRQFGIVFTVVFVIIGVWPLLGGRPLRWWSLTVAAVFLTVALMAPRLLAPLNRIWLAVGLLMHKVMSPIVLGLVFFSTVTPIAWLLRALQKDPLRRKFDPAAATYWIERRPPGPAGPSMPKQF